MLDQTPIDWVDGVTTLDDVTLNTEIRNAYSLLLNPPMCSLHSSAPNALAGNAWTALQWDSAALFDTEDPATPMYDPAFNTRVTIRTPGWYECLATVRCPSGVITATGIISSSFRVNGNLWYAGSTVGLNTGILDVNLTNMIAFNSGDYIEFLMTLTGSTSMTPIATGFMPGMMVVRRRGL